jgi:hypothetical protein
MVYETLINHVTGIKAELLYISDCTFQYRVSESFTAKAILSSEYRDGQSCRIDMMADYDSANQTGL